MKSFDFSPQTRSDLFEIWSYIAEEAGLDTSNRFKDSLYDACKRLAEFPGTGHRREDITQEPVRFWTVGAYTVIYLPLYIVRILRWSRNIPELL